MDKDKPGSTPSSPIGGFTEHLKLFRQLAQSGKSEEALLILQKAEHSTIQDDLLKPGDRDLQLSRIHINRGIIYKNMRFLEKSAECYEQAMKILSGLGEEAKREKFSAELNLAVLRLRMREWKKALMRFDNAEKLACQFCETEQHELLTKVLTNKAQLYLEFHEMDKARELLGQITTEYNKLDNRTSKEQKARVSAHLGQLIAHLAEKEDSTELANEHYNQAVRFFDDARRYYDELDLKRDSLNQIINRAEALIGLNRMDEAVSDLESVHAQVVKQSNYSMIASSCEKLLVIAILNGDLTSQKKWLKAALSAAENLTGEARNDFLENLESRLRWLGGDQYIEDVQKLRGQEGHN